MKFNENFHRRKRELASLLASLLAPRTRLLFPLDPSVGRLKCLWIRVRVGSGPKVVVGFYGDGWCWVWGFAALRPHTEWRTNGGGSETLASSWWDSHCPPPTHPFVRGTLVKWGVNILLIPAGVALSASPVTFTGLLIDVFGQAGNTRLLQTSLHSCSIKIHLKFQSAFIHEGGSECVAWQNDSYQPAVALLSMGVNE